MLHMGLQKYVLEAMRPGPAKDVVGEGEEVVEAHGQATNVFLARYAHHENPDIVSFALSPGWVQT